MIISKNISFGTIDVDVKNGKIWVNTPNCVLRISGIKFNKQEEKFSMIDIINNEAVMLNENNSSLISETLFSNFLEKLIMIVLPKICSMTEEESINFLDSLVIEVQENIKNK